MCGLGNGSTKIFIKNETNNSYSFLQEIQISTSDITEISQSPSGRLLVASSNFFFCIYEKINGTYSLASTYSSFKVRKAVITDEKLCIAGTNPNIQFYTYNGTIYELADIITTSEFDILGFALTEDFSKISFGGFFQKTYNIYKQNVNGSYELQFSDNQGKLIYDIAGDSSFLYFVYSTLASDVQTYYRCPTQCSGCTFPSNCTGCIAGYKLVSGECISLDTLSISYCVNNVFIADGVCEVYCHRKCKTCDKTRYDCVECA